jgi:hypothetical protein
MSNNKIRNIFSVVIVGGLIAYVIFRSILETQILISKGVCISATLTGETQRIQYHKSTLVYNFVINNKTYKGDSNIEDLSMAGQNICIVYYPEFPSINRPLYRFNGKVKCKCQ